MKRMEDNEFSHIEIDAGYSSACHRPVSWRGVAIEVNNEGYSKIKRTRDGKAVYLFAHRLRYEAVNGPIPVGLVPDHLCRNRWCCNPSHVEPVSAAENVRRGDVAKLTMEKASEIRRRFASGESQFEIAKHYNIDRSAISRIVNGKQWADGPCPAWESVKARRALARDESQRRKCHL